MRAWPPFVRAWLALLVLGIAAQTVVILGPWPQETVDTPLMQGVYDGVLLGAAVLCGMRVFVRSQERLAWTIIAIALAIYSGGNLFWSIALADLAEAPYPSVADGLWLGFYPLAYAAIALLARSRMPRLGYGCGSTV
jgi:hypothetical protein